jgi:hypothetical protein
MGGCGITTDNPLMKDAARTHFPTKNSQGAITSKGEK